MRRRDLVSGGGIGLLVLLSATLRASDADPARVERATGFVLVALAAVALAALGLRRWSAAGGGLAAGCLYGLGDVTSKLVFVGLPPHPGAGEVLASPWLHATLAAHGGGFVLLQGAFQQGGPVSSVASMTAAMNLLPIAGGATLPA